MGQGRDVARPPLSSGDADGADLPFSGIAHGRAETLGTLALVSIGVGGMLGGGIFAVTGLTINLTYGAAPIAFVVEGWSHC